ncbi:MAG TPA: cobalamin biosynthesis protein [Gemmataceae bacterium]|jgi:cobalamin biosynthesis protein CbiG|nr:cobalamin biosynthesis protein [Gemmataceae bacterium]
MPELAIVALTPRGLDLGQRLITALGEGEVVAAQAGARDILAHQFDAGRPLVCVMALGIVVRALGPLARDKNSDPPVVVVDEGGRFAISVLGGHLAGANALAERVARALGAVAVITTASDALGLPAVDLIGRDWGWQIEGTENLTRVAAAVVRGDPVGVYQQAGRRDWYCGEWPACLQRIAAWPPPGSWAGLLVISDLLLPVVGLGPLVVYRPRTLVLGVGCRRGVPCAEIEAMFQRVCQTHGFSALSLAAVATAAIKADEPGLQEFARRHGVPLQAFTLAELGGVGALPTPSAVVRAKIGIDGVAEPAAMLAAGSTTLAMPKDRGRRVTMALARKEEA